MDPTYDGPHVNDSKPSDFRVAKVNQSVRDLISVLAYFSCRLDLYYDEKESLILQYRRQHRQKSFSPGYSSLPCYKSELD